MVRPRPAAEMVIDAPLVTALLRAQHPDLADLPLRPFAEGWDNVMMTLGESLLVRLPRRAAAVPLLDHEQRWLGDLAPHLPLPVPTPVRLGRPSDLFPWAWSVLPFRPGHCLAEAPAEIATVLAQDLAPFLAALHRPAPADAPANPARGVPLAARRAVWDEALPVTTGLLDTAGAERAWQRALAAPVWSGPPLWLHGDLHPGNLLVHEDRLAGVVDFGDITAGDPATDLAAAWLWLPAAARPAFWHAYAATARHVAVDDALVERARGWALALAVTFVAHSADDPLLGEVGRRTARAIATDPDA